MSSIGKDRSILKPLDPEGRLWEDRLGANRGDFEGLNVRNAQPGYHYAKLRWRDPKTGRPDNRRILTAQRMGYQFPQAGEALGEPISLDTGTNLEARPDITFGDLVLMRCPIHRFAARSAEKEKRAEDYLTGGTSDFQRKGEGTGEEAYNHADRPLRFRLPNHGIRRTDYLE